MRDAAGPVETFPEIALVYIPILAPCVLAMMDLHD